MTENEAIKHIQSDIRILDNCGQAIDWEDV